MMVAMGAAMFMAVGKHVAPGSDDITRVVQGIAAGVGFLGAGTILKLSDQLEVKGLTTASSIWLSAGVGTAAGCGAYGLALGATVISVAVLVVLRPLEKKLERRD
jgi:putative Mg2+ transporter-C (MgtC) family protein